MSPPSAPDIVQIRNATRTSLRFQIPGQSVYILPGDKVEVPRESLDSAELKTLFRTGALVFAPPPGAVPVTPQPVIAAAESPEPAARLETRSSRRSAPPSSGGGASDEEPTPGGRRGKR